MSNKNQTLDETRTKELNPDLTQDQTEKKDNESKTLDPWERVEVTLPRAGEREDTNMVVGLNGVNYILPKGKKSMVPRCVAEEIERSEKAKDRFYQTVEGMIEKTKSPQ